MKNLIKTSVFALVALLTLVSCDPAGVQDQPFVTPYGTEDVTFDFNSFDESKEINAQDYFGYRMNYDGQNEVISRTLPEFVSIFYSVSNEVTVILNNTQLEEIDFVYISVEGHYYALQPTDNDGVFAIKVSGLDNITLVEDAVFLKGKDTACDYCKTSALKINF